MRVAIDARSLSERNTSNRTYWSELVSALAKCTDVELLLASNAPISAEDVPPGAETVVVSAPGRWFSLVILPNIASERKADVAHVQYTVSPLFRTPVVTTIHDVSYFVEPSWFGLKDRFLLQRTVPAACRRAARVVAPSSTCREEILAYIDVPPEKVVVTPEGTPSQLAAVTPDPTTLAKIVGDRPYALLVGGASPRKNLKGAVAVLREARRALPDLALLVTGSLGGETREPWVVAPGSLDERALAAAYRGAHALLHPSLHEGFGLTILEAMSLACPVVASDRGAIPEIAGDAAILCDADDARGMAEALVRLVNPAEREDRTRKGLVRAASFTWATTAAATVEAYRAASGSKPQ